MDGSDPFLLTSFIVSWCHICDFFRVPPGFMEPKKVPCNLFGVMEPIGMECQNENSHHYFCVDSMQKHFQNNWFLFQKAIECLQFRVRRNVLLIIKNDCVLQLLSFPNDKQNDFSTRTLIVNIIGHFSSNQVHHLLQYLIMDWGPLIGFQKPIFGGDLYHIKMWIKVLSSRIH